MGVGTRAEEQRAKAGSSGLPKKAEPNGFHEGGPAPYVLDVDICPSLEKGLHHGELSRVSKTSYIGIANLGSQWPAASILQLFAQAGPRMSQPQPPQVREARKSPGRNYEEGANGFGKCLPYKAVPRTSTEQVRAFCPNSAAFPTTSPHGGHGSGVTPKHCRWGRRPSFLRDSNESMAHKTLKNLTSPIGALPNGRLDRTGTEGVGLPAPPMDCSSPKPSGPRQPTRNMHRSSAGTPNQLGVLWVGHSCPRLLNGRLPRIHRNFLRVPPSSLQRASTAPRAFVSAILVLLDAGGPGRHVHLVGLLF